MILKVVLDANDRIVAVAHLPEIKTDAGPALMARPVLGPGMREFDIAVPLEHTARHPRKLKRALRVEGGVVVYSGAEDEA
jgi:hypothetical protein